MTALRPADAGAARRRSRAGLVLAVVLLAVNLRPAVASVGPVLADVRSDLALAAGTASLLTSLPVVCFGAAAVLAPRAARRLGLEATLALVLLLTAAGLALRVAGPVWVLFAGTLLAASAIAVGNVLLPALVKRDFPERTGLMTGVYTTAVSLSAAAGAALTVPAAAALGGWRGGLGAWAALALLALVVWLAVVPLGARTRTATPVPTSSLLRDARAWQVTAFMGLQSLGFYAMLAWLPSVLRDVGVGAAAAGALLGLLATVGTPGGLVLPTLMVRRPSQEVWVTVVTALTGAGLLGLALAPAAAPVLWAVLTGLGQGASFPLALTLVVLRSRDAVDAARLSAMAQGVGYALAALGPLLLGLLREATGSWREPLLLLVVLLGPQLLLGRAAARPGHVGGSAGRHSG